MSHTKKLIEVALPLDIINDAIATQPVPTRFKRLKQFTSASETAQPLHHPTVLA
jgi:hypothetical protein